MEKLTDFVGLYLNPPDKANRRIVLRVDEKSQIQALNRTKPDPMKKGVSFRRPRLKSFRCLLAPDALRIEYMSLGHLIPTSESVIPKEPTTFPFSFDP